MAVDAYLPILIFFGLGFFLSFALMGVAYFRSKKRPYDEKLSAYECGFDAFDAPERNARGKFTVQFYLIAILFIIFDLEIAFLFPWAVSFKHIGLFGFWSMMLFLSILTVGFAYEWKKGALDWE